jgi:hypothetical protein
MPSPFIGGVTTIAPRMPVAVTRTAISGGAPPNDRDTAIATPAVTDFGGSETSTARGAPSDLATRSADAIATGAPTTSAARHRGEIAPDQLAIAIERHGERDRRRSKQKVHELRAVEISLIVRPSELEQRAEEGDGDRHGIDDRMAARRFGEPVGDQESAKRRRQPEERRRLQIDPEAEREADEPLDEEKDADRRQKRCECRDDKRRGESHALLAQEPEILHHPDARRHEHERERSEKSGRRAAEFARCQHFVVERPPAVIERERDDQQGESDDRSWSRKIEPARQNLADELKENQKPRIIHVFRR